MTRRAASVRKGRVKCPTGKGRYRDRIAALLALAKVQWQDKPGRPKTERRAYRCPVCKGWHLTAQPLRGPSPRH